MRTPPPAPRSRRDRPAKPALTREGIVTTALGLVRAEGLEKVTLRRLARELDTGPASLYVYVQNVAELHAAILDELLAQVDLSEREGAWRGRLEEVLTSYTVLLIDHPALAQSAQVARPFGPHYLDLIERLLSLLNEGGVPAAQAAWGVDLLLQHATSIAVEQSTHKQNANTEDEWNALVHALLTADPATRPQIAALGNQLLAGAPRDRMSWAFQMLISGILATPVPHDISVPPQ
ncbi:TetR/AcrR family transcriptional regulator [Streptomyces sp. So13.3]|uniref:TetR/AcrR family transcriptional regulator n=1 Tax=Streptomyces sp. So13.3 TaxID=2136173 RepID=UPI001105A90B|nr:TetR/AcrR family transcriptional regulator C-terminal domain-containing protein [Streptomyces sp. So13.3]QNA76307.1 TetR/AcrR family transcriptional regulator [Streptomyces sp. So13.3]